MLMTRQSHPSHVIAAALVFTSVLAGMALSQEAPMAQPSSPKPRNSPPVTAKPAAAPPAAPDLTTETYGDWILRCRPAGDVRQCEMSQTLMLQGQTAPVAAVAVGRERKGAPLRLVLQLPVNLAFSSPAKVQYASNQELDLDFRRCMPSGCFADAALTDGILSRIRSQSDPLIMKFRDATERDISLPISTKGFGAATDALSRM
jgi:invasion protein IalB